MTGYPTTLAAFKRYLKDGGAITLRYFSYDGVNEAPHKYMGVTRTAVGSSGKNPVSLRLTPGDSWLTFGKAGDWVFEGNTASVHGEYGFHMTYEMGEPA
jgi:hypothetical protein